MPSATLDPVRVRAALLRVIAALAVLAVVAQVVSELFPGSVTANALYFLNAANESSIPTLFSTLLLLAAAGLAAAIAASAVRTRRRWWLLAAIVALLAVDEGAGFHEASIPPLRRLFDADGLLHYTWVVPGALFAAALVPLFRPLVADLSRRQGRLFVAGAGLFFGSAIGLELVEGAIADEHGAGAAGLIPVSTAQETFEMIGATLFLYVLMDRVAPWQGALRIERDGAAGRPNPR